MLVTLILLIMFVVVIRKVVNTQVEQTEKQVNDIFSGHLPDEYQMANNGDKSY